MSRVRIGGIAYKEPRALLGHCAILYKCQGRDGNLPLSADNDVTVRIMSSPFGDYSDEFEMTSPFEDYLYG